jgi:hypothetical protein
LLGLGRREPGREERSRRAVRLRAKPKHARLNPVPAEMQSEWQGQSTASDHRDSEHDATK